MGDLVFNAQSTVQVYIYYQRQTDVELPGVWGSSK